MKHVLRIANQHDAFFCPTNKLHLYYYNPIGEAQILSEDIIKALKNKKIIDVNGTVAKQLEALAEQKQELAAEPATESSVETISEDEEEPEIALEDLGKAELLSFIKENGMTMKDLGVTSKSAEDKIREAIATHLESGTEKEAE